MKLQKVNMVLVLVVFSLGMVVSPAFAHEKMWSFDRKPPRYRIAHSHDQQSQVREFNPIQSAAGLVGGVYKTIEGTIKAVLSLSPKAETEEQATVRHPGTHNRTGFLWGFPGKK